MTDLELASTLVTNDVFKIIGGMKSIVRICVANSSNIDDKGVDILIDSIRNGRLPDLIHVDLRGTQITADSAKKLETELTKMHNYCEVRVGPLVLPEVKKLDEFD